MLAAVSLMLLLQSCHMTANGDIMLKTLEIVFSTDLLFKQNGNCGNVKVVKTNAALGASLPWE